MAVDFVLVKIFSFCKMFYIKKDFNLRKLCLTEKVGVYLTFNP